MSTSETVIKIKDKIEIRRIIQPNPAQIDNQQLVIQNNEDPTAVQIEHPEAIIRRVGCEKIILKTSLMGPAGPMGETSTFNDLEIPSLAARFLSRLD